MNIKKIILAVAFVFPLTLFAGDDDSDTSSSDSAHSELLADADRLEAQRALGDNDDEYEDENCRSFVSNNRKSIACTLMTLICLAGGGIVYAATYTEPQWQEAEKPGPCEIICQQYADYTGTPPTDFYESVILGDIETYTLKPCPQAVVSSGRGRGRYRGRSGGGRGGYSSRKRRGGYSGPRLHKGLPVCTTAIAYTPDLPAETLPPANETDIDADLPDLIDE